MEYLGKELELFRHATNWKAYFSSKIRPIVRGTVLEVGAGIGENMQYLTSEAVKRWIFLEPDKNLAKQIQPEKALDYSVLVGTTSSLSAKRLYDTIIYIDVIEHIQEDSEELSRAYELLNRGGHLIVLCPAFNFLYSPFDKEIGHFKRYSRSDFYSIIAKAPDRCFYLDSCGFILSMINRFILRSSMPTSRNIYCWDKFVVPLSRMFDILLGNMIGRSVVGIWSK